MEMSDYTLPSTSPAPSLPATPRRKRRKSNFKADRPFWIGIICLTFSLFRLILYYRFFSMLPAGFTSQVLFSLQGLQAMAGIASVAGIGLAGLGLLFHQDWAEGLGMLAGILYIVVGGLGVIIGLASLAQVSPNAVGHILPRLAPRLIGEFLVPVMLVYEAQREK